MITLSLHLDQASYIMYLAISSQRKGAASPSKRVTAMC